MTETWLGSDIDKHVVSQLVPIGYNFHAVSRSKEKRGGGVALMCKAGIQVKTVTMGGKYTHFEHSDYYITSAGATFRLGVVYRPPPSRKNGFVNAVFFDDWSAYLDRCMLDPHEIIITGDLNFHLDTEKAPDVRHFSETLADHGMVQLVSDATHNKGHILDVVIVRMNSAIIYAPPSVYDPCLCDNNGKPSGDHYVITFTISARKPAKQRKQLQFRRLRQISLPVLKQDITLWMGDFNHDAPASDMATAYNSGLLEIIDRLAPLCTKTVTLRPHAPWYTDELRDEKRRRRSAERLWLSSLLEVHRQMYRSQYVAYNRMLIATKETYYSGKIANCGSDAKQLFNITKHLMGNEKIAKMPVHTCSSLMAQQFSDFFVTKVNTIQQELKHGTHDATKVVMDPMSDDVEFRGVAMNCFEPVTETDVERLVANAPAKSCELDPIPTWLLKQCSCELLPIITNVINTSLVTSVVPAVFKCAIVKPVLKKSTLDNVALHNYRPVSNLPFVSKLVERVAAKQLNAHLDDNALRDPFQSAYCAGHSTETALIHVKNDIAGALDRKCTTILVLLDLSCAFDTINHELLLRRLEHSVGISGARLEWLHCVTYVQQFLQTLGRGSKQNDIVCVQHVIYHGTSHTTTYGLPVKL